MILKDQLKAITADEFQAAIQDITSGVGPAESAAKEVLHLTVEYPILKVVVLTMQSIGKKESAHSLPVQRLDAMRLAIQTLIAVAESKDKS